MVFIPLYVRPEKWSLLFIYCQYARRYRMDLTDVRAKMARRNRILFSRESACLQDLLALIRQQTHRTLALWALACAQRPVRLLDERYPGETRPQTALALCREWAKGRVKMPEAKRALLQVHAMAKELTVPADIALCHAVGQACAAVHVETHAIGLPIYELTAIVLEYGMERCEKPLANRLDEYRACLDRCAAQTREGTGEWAAFLLDDSRPNKEWLLYQKTHQIP